MNITFDVKNQIISRTDTNRVVADSKNYLYAEFKFTSDWNGTKTAIFSNDNVETTYEQLLTDDKCLVPAEVLKAGTLCVSAFCGDLVTANKAYLVVEESGLKDGETPQPPTPDIYTQILEKAEYAETVASEIQEKADSGAFNGKDGAPGKDGAAATVAVGTVATGEPDTPASVTNSGTENAAVLDFLIPKGEKGDPGNSSITEIEPGASQTQPYVINSISGVYHCKNQGWVQVLSEEQTISSGITYQQPFFVGSNALILLGFTADAGKPGAGGTFITVLDDSFRIAFKPVQGNTQTVDLTFETLQAVVQLLQIISHFAGAIQNCDPGDIVTVLDQDMETGLYNLISKPADAALNDSSTFAVQNKVVTAALAQKKAVPAISTPSGSNITLENNNEYRMQETASLNLALPESIPDDYECSLVFESGDTATVLSYAADSIKFVGDDCDAEGDFVPQANKAYEVNVKNLGYDRIVARVGAF